MIEDRFWSKVKIGLPNECWLWMGAKNSMGYGYFGRNGHREMATRVAYRLTKGRLPAGKNVLHTCGNPSCVNPYHLRLA